MQVPALIHDINVALESRDPEYHCFKYVWATTRGIFFLTSGTAQEICLNHHKIPFPTKPLPRAVNKKQNVLTWVSLCFLSLAFPLWGPDESWNHSDQVTLKGGKERSLAYVKHASVGEERPADPVLPRDETLEIILLFFNKLFITYTLLIALFLNLYFQENHNYCLTDKSWRKLWKHSSFSGQLFQDVQKSHKWILMLLHFCGKMFYIMFSSNTVKCGWHLSSHLGLEFPNRRAWTGKLLWERERKEWNFFGAKNRAGRGKHSLVMAQAFEL